MSPWPLAYPQLGFRFMQASMCTKRHMALQGSLPIGPQGVTNYTPSIDLEEDEVKTSSTPFPVVGEGTTTTGIPCSHFSSG